MKRPSRYKALYGGRGSGKSHFFAEAMVANASQSKGFRAVCVREVQKSLKESAKRLCEDTVYAMGVKGFEVLNDSIRTPGGGVIIFAGMQDHTADSIKSLEGFHVAWVEEAQTLSARSLEMLRPTIRAPGSEIWCSWNPRSADDPVDKFFRGLEPPENAIIRKINYDQNLMFPEELELERQHDEKSNRARYSHVWEGAYEPQAVDAIWDRVTIHNNRRDVAPEMGRIVVAVDPAGSTGPNSDLTGIVVVARGDEDNHGYVLEDASMKGTPKQWAERVVALHDRWEADAVVAERNYGGDLVEAVIKAVRPTVRYIAVNATRAKHVRAEPISALYTLGRVHHVGTFPELENEMCLMTAHGYEGSGSPDRVDAAVWGLTELFPQMVQNKTRTVHVPNLGVGGWMN